MRKRVPVVRASQQIGVLTKVDLTGQDIYVGIAPGSGGSAWRDQMVNDITDVLDEYKTSGDIKGYKVVNNATNGDANEQVQIIRDLSMILR